MRGGIEVVHAHNNYVVPWGSGEHDELVEAVGAEDGGDGSGHGGERMADVDALFDVEVVEDGEQVIGEALEARVAFEVEVVGVGRAGAHVVVHDHPVAVDQVRDEVLPHGLVGPEPVPEHHGRVAATEDPDVVGFFHGGAHLSFFLSFLLAFG